MAKGPVIPEKLERWPVDRLVPYERNARTHSPEQVAQIAASIAEFGFTNPILVASDAGIIAGHGRLEAAKQLGLAEVPVVVLDHLSDAQRRAYVLADNQLALNAGWDADLLRVELQELEAQEFDLSLLGFSEDELSELLPEVEQLEAEEQGDPDQVPEAPENPITKPGDLWILGNHRLLCGDSTNIQHVERLMDGKKADMVFTDPPYGISYDESWRKVGSKYFGGSTDHKVANDHIADWSQVFSLMQADVAYVWHGHRFAALVAEGLVDAGYEVKQQIVWLKPFGIMSRQDYNWQHECAWYAIKKGSSHQWSGDNKQTTVWSATVPNHPMTPDDDARTVHPTQKPVDLAITAIQNHSAKLVLDLFGGSGTTLIACEKTFRHCRMMELDPAYCDVIVKRWEDFTGKIAALESTGEPFPDDE